MTRQPFDPRNNPINSSTADRGTFFWDIFIDFPWNKAYSGDWYLSVCEIWFHRPSHSNNQIYKPVTKTTVELRSCGFCRELFICIFDSFMTISKWIWQTLVWELRGLLGPLCSTLVLHVNLLRVTSPCSAAHKVYRNSPPIPGRRRHHVL